jgi:DNA-binding NarL/FixJ family response regulator
MRATRSRCEWPTAPAGPPARPTRLGTSAAQPGLLVVGQAADGADAVRQTRLLDPDVVLMDVRMPVVDGLEATRQILRAPASPQRPRVLMLTTFDLDDYVYAALRAGASGFLLKDATAAELAEISHTLVIAEQTTKTYVGRILAKLNLRDRAQADRWVTPRSRCL